MMKMDKRDLPDGWRLVKLDDVCEVKTGIRDPREEAEKPFRYVDIGSVDNETKRIAEAKTLIGKDAPSRARQVIKSGDIIVSTTRPNLNAVAVVPLRLDDQICSTGFCVLRPTEALDRDYLFAFVRSDEFVGSLSALVKGALYPAVTDRQVRSQLIPLPPLDEQRRIAAILSEQLAAVERARVAAKAQLDAAGALPAAYLREVFESEKAQGWPRHKIGDVATSVQNGIYKPAEYYGHGYPMLRMYNIRNDTWALTLERLALVELDKAELETFGLRAGDLLISRVNSFELVGKCAFVDARVNGYVFENMLIRMRLKDTVDSLFIAHQMGHSAVRRQIESVAKRAIGQSSINSTDIRNIEIALPSLTEQKRIAAMLKVQMAAVEQARKALQAQLDGINQLPGALLQQAFNGEL